MSPLLLLAAHALATVPPHVPPAVEVTVPPPAPVLVFFLSPPPTPLPLLSPAAPPDAPPVLPDTVRAVVAAAVASGDPQAVAAVVRFTKSTNPETAPQIDRINVAYLAKVAAQKAREEKARRDALLAGGPLDFWKGEVEIGGSRSSGNSDQVGIYASGSALRTGILWNHRIVGRVDYQRTAGITTTERANLAYQANRTISDRLYTYGLAQYEHDRLLGYTTRLSIGTGLGYRLANESRIKIEVEGGPVLRRTDFVAEAAQSSIAARASLNLSWKISPRITFSQNGAIFLDSHDSSANSTTALDTVLIGPLKARLAYIVQYEQNVVGRTTPTDTLSRATLIYAF